MSSQPSVGSERSQRVVTPDSSVSPLYSFCTVPTHRVVSFSAALRSIVSWLTGRQPKASKSEVQLEQRIVDLLAEELAENEPPASTSLIDKLLSRGHSPYAARDLTQKRLSTTALSRLSAMLSRD